MHAFIFIGEGEAGVFESAGQFARGLNCEGQTSDISPYMPESCGLCLSCRTFTSGNHPDTFYVEGTKVNSIGVEDVRTQVLAPMAFPPFKYKYKVFIINKAETLTPAAQNALLMTIEEPAPYGVFLFVSGNTHSLLPTVVSRSAVIKCQGEAATQESGLNELADEVLAKITRADVYDAFMLRKLFDQVEKSELKTLLDIFYVKFGDKISSAVRGGYEPKKVWYNSIQGINKAKRMLAQNGNQQLTLELMLLEMIE